MVADNAATSKLIRGRGAQLACRAVVAFYRRTPPINN